MARTEGEFGLFDVVFRHRFGPAWRGRGMGKRDVIEGMRKKEKSTFFYRRNAPECRSMMEDIEIFSNVFFFCSV